MKQFSKCIDWREEFIKYRQPTQLTKDDNESKEYAECWPGIGVGEAHGNTASVTCGPFSTSNYNWYLCQTDSMDHDGDYMA